MTKRLCVRCNKNRSLVDKAGRAVFAPKGKICVHCQKGATARSNKDRRLRDTYNMTLEQYDLMYEAQKGCCAICGGWRKVLEVDHCHKTLLVRGLICAWDNRKLLTAGKDSPELLRRGADYLENPPAVALIGSVYAKPDQPRRPQRGRRYRRR